MELNYCKVETPVVMTYCPLCHAAGNDIVIGEVYKYIDEDGDLIGYGHPGGVLAQALISDETPYVASPIKSDEKVPSGEPCSDCAADIKMRQKKFEAEVVAGGLHWACEECGLFGVIVKNDSIGFCAATRDAAGVQPPNQLGVRFDRCEQHESADDPTVFSDTVQ